MFLSSQIEYGAGDLQEMLKIYDWEANGLICKRYCLSQSCLNLASCSRLIIYTLNS